MNHEIAFTDPGAANVIRDLQEILLLIQQIKAAGGGALFGGAGAPGGGSVGGIGTATLSGLLGGGFVGSRGIGGLAGTFGFASTYNAGSFIMFDRFRTQVNSWSVPFGRKEYGQMSGGIAPILENQVKVKLPVVTAVMRVETQGILKGMTCLSPEAGMALNPAWTALELARLGKRVGIRLGRHALTELAPHMGMLAGMARGAATGGSVAAIAGILYGTGQNYYEMIADEQKFFAGGNYPELRTHAYVNSTLGRAPNPFGYTPSDTARTFGWEAWKRRNILKKLWDIGSWEVHDPVNMGQSMMGHSDPYFIDTPEIQELSTETIPLSRFLSNRSDLEEMQRRAAGKNKAQRVAIYRQFLTEYNIPLNPHFVYQEEKRKGRVRAPAGAA